MQRYREFFCILVAIHLRVYAVKSVNSPRSNWQPIIMHICNDLARRATPLLTVVIKSPDMRGLILAVTKNQFSNKDIALVNFGVRAIDKTRSCVCGRFILV